MWGLVVISLMLLVFFFKKSKSNFFRQPKMALQYKRQLLWSVLKDFEVQKQWPFIEAYDYFMENPTQFDGATIVKDVPTIRGLDAPAMLHDYQYIHIAFWTRKGFAQKIKSDWNYGCNMEQLGVLPIIAYTRAVLLIVSTPLYYMYRLTLKL